MSIKKHIQRGRGSARLADGATLYDPADDSHVQQSSPISLKVRELAAKMGDKTYTTAIAPDIKEARQKETTRKRASKDTRPI